ncbi:MAG: MOSC domain-containing protein [Candidatus Caldarchaeales archaeon]
MAVGRVGLIARYPLLGCGGEELPAARFAETGVEGDRAFALVEVDTGLVLEPVGRTYSWGRTASEPRLLFIAARLRGGELEVELPDGSTASGEDAGAVLSGFLGRDVKVVRAPWLMRSRASAGRAVHLLTDRSVESLRSKRKDTDFRFARFRPNVLVVVDGDAPEFPEDLWVGRRLALGSGALLRVESRNPRCEVTTLPQRFAPRDPGVLEAVSELNGGCLGLMCSVLREGTASVGDRVDLI